MKKITIACCLLLLVGCQTKKTALPPELKKPSVVKLNNTEINSLQKSRTYELGKRVLMTCNTSAFKPFITEEATSQVIQKMTRESISLTCQNILRGFGKFNDMQLMEAYRMEKEKLTIFRYKCDYEKKHCVKELRVTINNEDKITSITTKDWSDDFK
jgi:hypothetical protein